METLNMPLSKNQLELLSLFNNRSVSGEEWGYVKEMIAGFFAKKSIDAALKAWDENGWDESKVGEILKAHLRTRNNPGNQSG